MTVRHIKQVKVPSPCVRISLFLDYQLMKNYDCFRRSFSTENRKSFKGHDVRQHPVPNSYKTKTDSYHPPSDALLSETSNRVSSSLFSIRHAHKQMLVI